MLLNHGADVNARDTDGGTALYYECNRAYLDMIKHIKTNDGKGPADQEALIESYDKWPLATSGDEDVK